MNGDQLAALNGWVPASTGSGWCGPGSDVARGGRNRARIVALLTATFTDVPGDALLRAPGVPIGLVPSIGRRLFWVIRIITDRLTYVVRKRCWLEVLGRCASDGCNERPRCADPVGRSRRGYSGLNLGGHGHPWLDLDGLFRSPAEGESFASRLAEHLSSVALGGMIVALRSGGAMPVTVGALLVLEEAGRARSVHNGLPLVALTNLASTRWRVDACPLCAAGVTVRRPGHENGITFAAQPWAATDAACRRTPAEWRASRDWRPYAAGSGSGSLEPAAA